MQNQQIQKVNWNVLMGLKEIYGMDASTKEVTESAALIPTFPVMI